MSTTSDPHAEMLAASSAAERGPSIASEVERLANAILAQWPGGAPLAGGAPTLGSAPVPTSALAAPFTSSDVPSKPPVTLDPSAAVGPLSQPPTPSLPTSFATPAPQAATLAPLPPPRLGPSALNVGAGGASPALALPPVPGALKEPPLVNAPAPRESDLRNFVSVYSENVHGGSAVPLLASVESGPPATPYFLDLAGVRDAGAPYFVPAQATPDAGGSGASRSALSAPSLSAAPIASPAALPGAPLGIFPEAQAGALPSFDPPAAPIVEPPLSLGAPGAASLVPPANLPANLPGTSFAPTEMPGDSDGVAAPASPLRSGAVSGVTAAPDGYVPELVRAPPPGPRGLDAYAIKQDFPILRERIHGKRLVWLDNAATTHKPQSVIDRISYFYEHENSNIHRAAHTLAARSTDAYEDARDKVHRFLNTPSTDEVIFVRGATEAINLVAKSWGDRFVGPGDEIVITWLEHHANIVPWQQLASEKGAKLRVVPVDDSGQVLLSEYEKLLGPRTRLVSMPHVSNALGTIVPVREMVQIAQRYGAATLVDGAQAVSHMPVDVQQLDCDFYVFSGHKVFAPTGIGVLYGKPQRLEAMPPWQGGGNMIQDVTFEQTTFQGPPQRFEAGTSSIGDAVGLGAALDYVSAIGLENVSNYEHELLVYGTQKLLEVPGLRMIGTAREKAGVMSFVIDGVRTEEVGSTLDRDGIAVRAGHHCAQPILRRFGLEATVRASLAPYNTREDLDALAEAVARLTRAART